MAGRHRDGYDLARRREGSPHEQREDARTGSAGMDLGKSNITIPIPGFKTTAQVRENAGRWPSAPSRQRR